MLRDLESTNGTYVNGKRIAEVTLTDGDVIVIADFELTFFSGQPQAASDRDAGHDAAGGRTIDRRE